jgi:ABC-type nickel/cobalt efflux system permease component RcnA
MTWLERPVAWVLALQREAYLALGSRIQAIGDGPDGFLGAVGLAFVLGMIHALTPGHGKGVVFSYFLGARARPWGGVLMAVKVAATHAISAAVLVALAGTAASLFGRPSGVARILQAASYALIVAVGVWLFFRSISDAKMPSRVADVFLHRHVSSGLLPLAVGLLPCPMTMLVLTYALSHATLLAGITLVIVMGVGVAATIAVVGTAGIAARYGLFARLDPRGRAYVIALNGLQIASSAAIVVLGAVFLAGSLG